MNVKKIYSLFLVLALLFGLVTGEMTSDAASLKRPVVKVVSSTKTSVKLKITKVKKATSYRIYQSTSKKGTYKKVATTKKTSRTIKKLRPGKTYYYKVKAVRKKQSSKYSKIVRVKTKPNTSTGGSSSSGNTNQTSTTASEMLTAVNKQRRANGCESIQLSDSLNKAAEKRAKELVQSFSHERPDGRSCFTVLEEFGISYFSCGENIAAGQTSVSQVMNSWMNSEGHRANILSNEYRYIGVGRYQNYWVQLFMS